MKSTALCAFSLLLCTCPAAVPLRWTVETSRAVPAQIEAYQGETLELEAALKSYGTPLEAPAQYSLYWQTNGMGNAWWEAPCAGSAAPTNVLFATWSPTNDVGAKVYNCFVGRPGAIYHAAFQLRLRPSPGATPSALEPPVKVLDFAAVEVRNAPYFVKAETAGLVAAASSAATNHAAGLCARTATSATNYTDAATNALAPQIASKYSKPDGGIPKTDLAAAVQTSLERADTALQSYTETDPVWSAEKSGYLPTSSAWGGQLIIDENTGEYRYYSSHAAREFKSADEIATMGDIPDVSGFETVEHAATAYQPKGDYLTAAAAALAYKPLGWFPAWGDVTGKPQFAAVATSGSYEDLSGKPDIPGTNGFVTASVTNGLASTACVDAATNAAVAAAKSYADATSHVVDTNANLKFKITADAERFFFTPVGAINTQE